MKSIETLRRMPAQYGRFYRLQNKTSDAPLVEYRSLFYPTIAADYFLLPKKM